MQKDFINITSEIEDFLSTVLTKKKYHWFAWQIISFNNWKKINEELFLYLKKSIEKNIFSDNIHIEELEKLLSRYEEKIKTSKKMEELSFQTLKHLYLLIFVILWDFPNNCNKSPQSKNKNLNNYRTICYNQSLEQKINIIQKEISKYTNLSDRDIKIIVWKNWKIGSYLSENIIVNKDFEYKYSLIDSIKYWILETYNQSLLTVKWIWILWQKIFNPKTKNEREEAISNMKWPIWIVDLVANSMSAWIMFLLIIAAIISINLWVFNLLPIPALDWGRWLLISINTFLKKIFWEKININYFENIIHLLFFIILIALSLIIWYNDIINIINR